MSTKKERTRHRLLEAAERLLLDRGFHQVSLEDIAEAAGVSRQAVYKSHFGSKADLLLALVQHVHVTKNLDELVAPVLAATDAIDKLEKTILAILDIESRVHDLALLLSAAATSDEGARMAWMDRIEVKRGALHQALGEVRAAHRLKAEWPLNRAVDVLAVLVSVEAYEHLVVREGWSIQELGRRVLEICHATLLVCPD